MEIKKELLDELLKDYKKPEDVIGENGLLKQLTKALLERAMSAELTNHLGYEKSDPAGYHSGNSRNGATPKTLKGDFGEMLIETPRDRNGSFEPQIIKKHQTRFDGFDDKILSMYARGMTTREIQGHLQEMYGVEVSPTLISEVTDGVMEEVKAWQNRPLEPVYGVVYLDALYVKMRHEGRVENRAVYVAIGIGLVGDATDQGAVVRLMGGDAADLVFTDPPYNVDYEGYTEERLKLRGDRMSDGDFKLFLEAAFRSYRTIVKPGASLYVCHSSSWQREFQNALEAGGFEVRCQIVWAKNTFAWGFGRYKFQHEPLFYAHVTGQKDPWYGDKSQSTLWEEKKPAANRMHPTAKPVELIERALLNSSKAGDLVVDLFGGSGSTLIGCERRGRKACLMEIDPEYADCIIRRFQEYTGKKAKLEGDGRTFEEIATNGREEPK